MDFSAKDILWHVLYDTDIQFIKEIALPSAKRMAAYGNTDGLLNMLDAESSAMTLVRVIFFILLNIDEKFRSDVCSAEYCSKIHSPKHGKVMPLCPYKADRFFRDLNTKCVSSWMRNETKSMSIFLEELRMLYLVS